MCNPNMKNSKFMTLQPNMIPKGCYREIRKYQACAANSGEEPNLEERAMSVSDSTRAET